jgi:mycofactocin system FadH/OYE family oxidoreductase 2
MTQFSTLFTPYTLKNITLRNRLVMLPHVTFYATADRRPSARLKNYYSERAKGGVGLIVTESQTVHVTGGCDNCVDASNRAGMLEWRDGVTAVHEQGAKFFAQLTHHGLETFTLFSRREQWGPSPIPNPAVREIPKMMDKRDIAEAVEAFRVSAANVREAGFDGVELKVGHDGLLRTFLSPFYNRRPDEYGGSPENRARFVLEVLAAVRTAVGDDFPIGFRFCLDEGFPGGYGLADALAYARLFAASGQLDYFSSDMGTWMSVEMQVPPMVVPQGFALDAVAALKQATPLPVIAFGRLKRPEQAEQLLAEGKADLVGMARQFIADAEFVNKVKEGRLEEIRPCVACNQECVGRLQNLQAIACVHNPAAGHEAEWGSGTLTRTAQPKKVWVIGGGPMGLKTAEIAAKRGHHVTLIEQGAELGGQVRLAATAPHHAEWGQIVSHLAAQVARLGVNVRLNTQADAAMILAERPDAVIIATGSGPGPLPFALKGNTSVLNEWQVLTNEQPANQNVLLYDLGVKFEGAAVAETLAARGNRVQWVTPTFVVGAEIDPTSIGPLRRRLAEHGVQTTPEHTIIEVNDEAVVLFNVLSHRVTAISTALNAGVPHIESIVIAGNKASHNSLYHELEGKVPALYSGGDAIAPRNVYAAVVDGERIGREI